MIKVLKFGGTSVGSAANMRRVADIIATQDAKVTVLSAMSGTTDALVKISSLAAEGAETSDVIKMLEEKYYGCISELLKTNRAAAEAKTAEVFGLIGAEVASFDKKNSSKKILAQGELLTSAIFTLYIKELGRKAELINILNCMHTLEDGKVDTKRLKAEIAAIMSASDADTVYITQGFICTNYNGTLSNLGRGGSDYSAALIGAAIAANEVQIWTDIDGMHNNDPRFVENTYPIRRMSFDEAAELAYFGAKILHPSTIQPCKECGISVRLKNSMDPDAEGTLITTTGDAAKQFHAVAAKDNITVVRICSARMLMAYGFLRRVFEVFEKHCTPIDMITTSEVAVSLTIDNDSALDDIVAELSEYGTISVERNNSIICVVGKIEYTSSGLAARILEGIDTIPVKMISYGASDRSVTFLISSEDKKSTLQLLNNRLFNLC